MGNAAPPGGTTGLGGATESRDLGDKSRINNGAMDRTSMGASAKAGTGVTEKGLMIIKIITY